MKPKYLHRTGPHTLYLDHRVLPEVRAMFAAMISRVPKGGIEARYRQVVEKIVADLKNNSLFSGTDEEYWDIAEEKLCSYIEVRRNINGEIDGRPVNDEIVGHKLHPVIQEFFDIHVGKYGHGCYDEKTEVLVRHQGEILWMSWEEAYSNKRDVELAAVDPNEDILCFERPTDWVCKSYSGPMYGIQTQKDDIDLLTTPDHRMCVRKREYVGGSREERHYKWSNWRALPAEELDGTTNYRMKRSVTCSVTYDGTPLQYSNPWELGAGNAYAYGQLCGFFIGDGYAGGRQASYLSFHIRKRRKVEFLHALAARLGVEMLEHSDDKFHLKLEGARDWARENFYADEGEKKIPQWIFGAPVEFIRGLFDGLKNSDGSEVTPRSFTLFSTSLSVVEPFQILAHMNGAQVSISRVADNGHRTKACYAAHFSENNRGTEPVINRNRKDDFWEDYSGHVYCASVSTGFLMVRRNGTVCISGNSIKELTGSPVVFIEGISFWAAYLTFDNPLVKGQEMSTRAVWRRDWPWAADVADSRLLKIHKLGLEIAWHELEWWKEELRKPCEECGGTGKVGRARRVRGRGDLPPAQRECSACSGTGKKYPWMNDPQAFRPAFDRARWAIPGTCSTGVVHTADVRTMGRVLRVMEDMARGSQHSAAIELVEEIKDCYRQAMPGMAGLWLKEAVHEEEEGSMSPRDYMERVPYNIQQMNEDMEPAIERRLSREVQVLLQGMHRDPGFPPRKTRTYLDPWYNQMYVSSVMLAPSWACARDWHRHRPMMPWKFSFPRDPMRKEHEDGSVTHGHAPMRLHHMYEPRSDFGKEHVARYFQMCSDAQDYFFAQGDAWAAMVCAPLGAETKLLGGAGGQDLTYMVELRAYTRGANFEYKAQAEEMIRQITRQQPQLLEIDDAD